MANEQKGHQGQAPLTLTMEEGRSLMEDVLFASLSMKNEVK